MTPQQTELQNAIILSCHNGLTLEGAKQKELGFGCLIKSDYSEVENIQQVIGKSNYDSRIFTSLYPNGFDSSYIEDIIGMPATLARILQALGDDYSYIHGYIREMKYTKKICDRKKLNDNSTDCHLFEQSEDVQDILYNIICKK